MSYFIWSTIILSIWGALGPIFGIWYGNRIAQEGQKRQWLFDNKRQEYREVIQALSAALSPIIQCVQPGLLVDGAALQARNTAENLSYEILGSRIFIAEELDKVNAYEKWVALIDACEKKKDTTAFTKAFSDLIRQIRIAALQAMEVEARPRSLRPLIRAGQK